MAGYARCSTDAQDLTPQLDVLTRLGVGPQRLYAGQGLTGTTRDRPGLREALAAVRAPRGHPGGRQTRPALPTEVDLQVLWPQIAGSGSRARYRVDRPIFRCLAMSVTDSPRAWRARAMARVSWSTATGLPPRRPWAGFP